MIESGHWLSITIAVVVIAAVIGGFWWLTKKRGSK
jgi:hypothetical protein